MSDDNTYAISQLKRKRGELAGHLLILQQQEKTVRGDMAAVDRALTLLDPAIKPREIKPIRRTIRYKYFDAGEMAQMLLDVMREAKGKPASIPELTRAVMAAKGLDPDHTDAFKAIAHRLTIQLHKLHARGTIEKTGARLTVRWALTS